MSALPLPAWPTPLLPSPNRGLRVAIAASIGLHMAVLAWHYGALPALVDAPRPTLNVVLRHLAPAPIPPAPHAIVAPVPTPTTEPQRVPPPATRSIQPAPRPAPVITRHPAPNTPLLPAVSPPPRPAPVAAAISPAAVARTTETPPTQPNPPAAPALTRTTPPPPPHAEPTAAEASIDPTALDRYGRNLSNLFASQQNYPRLAALRGWEGEVQLRLTIARKGNIVATQVVRSSGFEVLDQSAIQLVSGAGPLPLPPDNLKNREFQVIVPVHYRLEKS